MKRMHTILLLLILAATSLACNIGTRLFGEPAETIPVTTEAIKELRDKVEDFESIPGGGSEIELTITEAEVTSMVALEIKKDPNVPIEDVQVFLRDGQVRFTGSYRESGINLPLEAVAEPTVNSAGDLKVELISAKIGPVSAPGVLRDRAQEVLDEAVNEVMTHQAGSNFEVSSVVITDGTISIRGWKQ